MKNADATNILMRKRNFTECKRSLRKKNILYGIFYCFTRCFFRIASGNKRRISEAAPKSSRSSAILNNAKTRIIADRQPFPQAKTVKYMGE